VIRTDGINPSRAHSCSVVGLTRIRAAISAAVSNSPMRFAPVWTGEKNFPPLIPRALFQNGWNNERILTDSNNLRRNNQGRKRGLFLPVVPLNAGQLLGLMRGPMVGTWP
jgi:hypothetical protein